MISDDESRQYASWRSGGTYKTPSVPLWKRGWEFFGELYSREGMDLAREAEAMAVCRIIYDGREASQDMNTVREWRLDELIRRAGTKIKVEYDRQEKKMTLLLPDGSIKYPRFEFRRVHQILLALSSMIDFDTVWPEETKNVLQKRLEGKVKNRQELEKILFGAERDGEAYTGEER